VAKNLREIRKIVYRLKHEFGLRIVLKKPLSTSYDIETGERTQAVFTWVVRRAVVTPMRQLEKFSYDLSFVAANKNFTYGGTFLKSTRSFIIDARDLPNDFEIDTTCIIEFTSLGKTRTYRVSEMQLAEHGQAWLIIANDVEAEKVEAKG